MPFFRFLDPLPLFVEFKSETFRVVYWRIEYSGKHHLIAETDPASRAHWMVAFLSSDPEQARLELYFEGFEVQQTTVAEIIMHRLCREKRAERVGPGIPRVAADRG